MGADRNQGSEGATRVLTPAELGVQGRAGLLAWLSERRAWIRAERLKHGALLLRGFGLSTSEDFAAALEALALPLMTYREGHARRAARGPRVYTTTTWPASQRIDLHNELCFLPRPPRLLALFCVRPADEGGATPISDGAGLWDALRPATRAHLEGRRLVYLTNRPDQAQPLRFGRSWQEVYGTERRAAVEATLTAEGARFEWRPDGGLRTWLEGPVRVAHPETGALCWFNQAALWHVSNLGAAGERLRRLMGEHGVPTNAFLDGLEPLDEAALADVRAAAWARARWLRWQAGDLALVDNVRVSHGRDRFTGPREVLLAMASDVEGSDVEGGEVEGGDVEGSAVGRAADGGEG